MRKESLTDRIQIGYLTVVLSVRNEGTFVLDGQTGLIPWNVRQQSSNNVATHVIRTENTSDNALNELFVDCDSDLYNIDDKSNVNGNLPVQKGAAVTQTDNEDIDIVEYTSISQFVANVCLFIV